MDEKSERFSRVPGTYGGTSVFPECTCIHRRQASELYRGTSELPGGTSPASGWIGEKLGEIPELSGGTSELPGGTSERFGYTPEGYGDTDAKLTCPAGGGRGTHETAVGTAELCRCAKM